MSDDEIFAGAYRAHYWAVSRYVARRLDGGGGDVEEVVAEVFTVAWRRRADLPASPLPWLYGVARNCLANTVRGHGRRRRLLDRLGNDETARGRQLVASPDEDTPGGWVHEALARLSPADREVLRLTAWEQLGIDEVAVALGCGSRAAAMRLHRARRRLRTEIDRMGIPRQPGGPPDTGTPPGTDPASAGPAPDGPSGTRGAADGPTASRAHTAAVAPPSAPVSASPGVLAPPPRDIPNAPARALASRCATPKEHDHG